MWMLNMGKPDSIPKLNEQMAIELGANLLGETIVFVVAAGIILVEYTRQVRKESTKEEARKEELENIWNKMRDLSFQMETQDAQIRQLMHLIADLDSRVVRIPWKGPLKHTKDDKHEFVVTKEQVPQSTKELVSQSSEKDKNR